MGKGCGVVKKGESISNTSKWKGLICFLRSVKIIYSSYHTVTAVSESALF